MTYGTEAESAAAALRFLVVANQPPREAGELILQLRELAIGSTIDLVDALRAPNDPWPDQAPAGGATRFGDVWESGPKLLVRILHQLPRLAQDRRVLSPLDLLDAGDASPVPHVQAWAAAARLTTLAVHELQRDPDKEWRADRAAAWSVVGDAAATTEALVLIDDHLEAAGLLDDLEVHPVAEERRTQRLEAAGVASVAGWMMSDRGWVADRASSNTVTHRTPEGVLLVRTPQDLARVQQAAAQATATYTRQGAWGERLGVRPAAALAFRDLQISEDLASAAGRTRGAEQAHGYFSAAAERWAALAAHLQPLRDLAADATPSQTEQLLVHQQSETARQVRRFAEGGQLRSLDAADLLHLANATHSLFAVTALAIRKTVSPRGSALVAYRPELKITDPVNAARPGFTAHRFSRNSRLVRTLNDLMSAEPPARADVERSLREGLSAELRRSPSSGEVRRPTPGGIDGGRGRDDWAERRPHHRGPRA